MDDPTPGTTSEEEYITVFQAVGGLPFFESLVDRFYAGVVDDPILLPMYPENDLGGARQRLALFLAQYWGGPTTYSDARGHPRLRMRHFPFTIGETERDAWLARMTEALDGAEGLHPELYEKLHDYFAMAAQAMVNT